MRRLLWLLALLPLLLTGCFLPPGVQLIVGGDANYYDAPSRTVALAPDQPVAIMAHEACHAHQHQMILEKDPASRNLWGYFSTSEGMSYMALTGQTPPEATLEDAAWACAWWYLDQSRLTPAESTWAAQWLH